jgi:hypothetical protein
MVLIPLERRGKNLFIHVYKSKWPKISLSRVLTQPVLFWSTSPASRYFIKKVGKSKTFESFRHVPESFDFYREVFSPESFRRKVSLQKWNIYSGNSK